MSHLLSEYFQNLLLTMFLFVRHTDFKGVKDHIDYIVLDRTGAALSALFVWGSSVCSKERQVSSEQMSFQDLGYVAV